MQLESIPFVLNVFVGFIVIAVILFNGKKNFRSNVYLLGLTLIVLGYQTKAIVVLEGYYSSFPHFIKLFLPLHFLLGPFFYLYVKNSLIQEESKKPRWPNGLHYLPFMAILLILFPFYIKSGTEKLVLHSSPQPGSFDISGSMLFYYVPLLISLLAYCLASISLIRKEGEATDNRKNHWGIGKLKWLLNYSYAFLFFVFLYLSAQLVFIFTDFKQFYVMLTVVFSSSIFVYFLTFWALKESLVMISYRSEKAVSNAIASLYPQKKAEIIKLLEHEKIYLDSHLTSNKFAQHLGINTNYLSQIVNSEFKCNLTHLINSYRIDHAKKILKDEAYNNLNFLGIASQSGFNSANSFSRVFKQHTGKTPSQFKKGA